MKNNENAFVLILVLAISIISLAFMASIFYMVFTTSSFITKGRTYLQTIEISKGISQVVIDKLLNGNLTCTDCSPCNENCSVDISDVENNFSDFEIKVKLKAKIDSPVYTLYGFVVTTTRKNSSEKSEIEFVYKK